MKWDGSPDSVQVDTQIVEGFEVGIMDDGWWKLPGRMAMPEEDAKRVLALWKQLTHAKV